MILLEYLLYGKGESLPRIKLRGIRVADGGFYSARKIKSPTTSWSPLFKTKRELNLYYSFSFLYYQKNSFIQHLTFNI